MSQKKYSLEKYRKAAEKTPFLLELDDGTTISIAPPKGKAIMKLAKIDEGEVELQLQLIAGDAYDALMDAIGDESFEVLNAVMEDLAKHFGFDKGESNG